MDIALRLTERFHAAPAATRVGAVEDPRWWATVVGLGLWLIAACAGLEGAVLGSRQPAEDAVPWLVAAAFLGLVSVKVLEAGGVTLAASSAEGPLEPPWEDPRHQRQRQAARWLLALAWLAAFGAAAVLVGNGSAGLATWSWLVALVYAFIGAVLLQRRPSRQRWRPGFPLVVEVCCLLVVVGLAVWLRVVPDLGSMPPFVIHPDEANIGLGARQILAGDMPWVFGTGWESVPALSFALHALTMELFGDNLLGLRMASAIEGVLSIVVLYLLVRRLWGAPPALFSAAFMAIAAWHIYFSRTGFHYMQGPLAVLLASYFVVRGVQDRRPVDWLLCGFAIGLSLQVYYSARLAPLVVAVYLGYRILTEGRGFVRANAGGMLALVFGVSVFLLPMAVVYARHPETFNQRTLEVLVTAPTLLQSELRIYNVTTLQEILAVQARQTLEVFNLGGASVREYGDGAPLFDVWTGALLAMSALAVLLRPGSARGVLLTAWVVLSLLAVTVTTMLPGQVPPLRLLVILPALVLGPALMLEYARRGVTRVAGPLGAFTFGGMAMILFGLALQANAHDVFDVNFGHKQASETVSLLVPYARGVEDRYRVYVIGQRDWTLADDDDRFLLPNLDPVDVRDKPLALPLDDVPMSKGAAFVVESAAPDSAQRLAALEQAYPSGRTEVIERANGQPFFTSYLVENAALLAAEPDATRD